MFLREITFPVNRLKGAGPSAQRILGDAGINSVASLLTRYPRDWEDRRCTILLKDWNKGPVCTVVKVLSHEWFGFGRMKTLKVHVEDESARAMLVCFNRPFLQKQLPVGEQIRIWGKFYYKYGELQATAFEIENPGIQKDFMNPVYPLSKELTHNLLRRLIQQALDQFGSNLEDEIPQSIMVREKLLPKKEALRAVHFPESMEILEQARNTLIFEELFYLEIMVGRRALERKKEDSLNKGTEGYPSSSPGFSPLQINLIERLPFSLTPGQEKAIGEINADMSGPWPLARLLQGDVGSGKTLVAFLAALRAVDEGGQAAIMAPTELLARQHANNAARLLEPLGIRPAYLTGNLKSTGRSRLLENLAAGEVDIVLGTHALFSKDVIYRNLSLVIIDEQHRFGVTQRQAIVAKGQSSLQQKNIPDLLMMSATPIPRTLALTVFGDLDISVISDMPPGRKPVKTHLAKESNAEKVYDFVQKELEAGRQAYFVFPLIGENETSGSILKDAVSMAEKLAKEIYPQYSTALIHSKLDDEEKRKTMEAFRAGEIRILAATSVVEVGVDVPNASCMVIHHAERFGLSALHQLRGRVGRGRDQAYCFLIYSDQDILPGINPLNLSEEERSREGRRLMVMLENRDGFIIAEKDLLFRGPGQIAGIEQSGYLKLGIADPVRDTDALIRARTEAFGILEKDPCFLLSEHRCIAEVLERSPPFAEVGL
ncbi:MAG: ATP-dependent DNA helicase RecG [Treponema sp.]|jgi:ATP-dependent DNA helicase RecG|nr:ATP-dependent DNA helicase RecG [Treponema sp.]